MPRDFKPQNLTGKETKKDLPLPPAVINELKKVIKDETPQNPTNVEVITPIVENVINSMIGEANKYMAEPNEEVVDKQDEPVEDEPIVEKDEPSVPTATKQTLRICDQMNVEVHVVDDEEDEIKSEMDTITLADTILPYEECLVSVVPKAGLPIKQVISAYIVYDKSNINFDLCHIVLDLNEGDKSFQMCIKNKGEFEHVIKIQYHVIF